MDNVKINAGTHRVMILGSEGKGLSVRFNNGTIRSFLSDVDFSAVGEYINGAVIEVVVDEISRIKFADNTAKNLATDETLIRCIELYDQASEMAKTYKNNANLIFNLTCCTLEDDLIADIEKEKLQIEYMLARVNKGIDLLPDFIKEKMMKNDEGLRFFGGMYLYTTYIARTLDEAADEMLNIAIDQLEEQRADTKAHLLLCDDVYVPGYEEAMQLCLEQIERRRISLSYEKIATEAEAEIA